MHKDSNKPTSRRDSSVLLPAELDSLGQADVKRQMRALVVDEGSLKLRRVAVPIPGPGEALVRVMAAGICRTDMFVAAGKIPVNGPLIVGHEFSGVVCALGTFLAPAPLSAQSKPRPFRLGDRVGAVPFSKCDMPGCVSCSPALPTKLSPHLAVCPKALMMGVHTDGCFAEYALVKQEQLILLPKDVSFLRGAYLEPVAASMAVLHAGIAKDMRGLIFGENRIAQLTGRVLAACGFSHVEISAKPSGEDVYDFVIETAPFLDEAEALFSALRPRGIFVAKSRRPGLTLMAFPFHEIVKKEISLRGAHYGDFAAAMRLIGSEALLIDDLFGETFSLDDYESALSLGIDSVNEATKTFFLP